MTDGSDRWQELDSVLDRVLDGIYDDKDLRRLNEILGLTWRHVGTTYTMWNCTAVWLGETR